MESLTFSHNDMEFPFSYLLDILSKFYSVHIHEKLWIILLFHGKERDSFPSIPIPKVSSHLCIVGTVRHCPKGLCV